MSGTRTNKRAGEKTIRKKFMRPIESELNVIVSCMYKM